MIRRTLRLTMFVVCTLLATGAAQVAAAPPDNVPAVGVGYPWFFAEGSTQPGFTTWLLLMNPNQFPIAPSVIYYKEDGTVINKKYSLQPTSRLNILVNKEVPNAALAMYVASADPIFAERAMYSGHDGHVSHGRIAPTFEYYFAEGATSPPFQMWLLLANTSPVVAHVTLTFMKEDGGMLVKNVDVAPTSRKNVFVNDYFPYPGAAVATYIKSDLPIVAERSMYWNGGSHNTPGSGPFNTWYLAEGYTGDDFHTWILLMNPGNVTANVTMRFFKEDGTTTTQTRSVNPHSRRNVFVNDFLPGVAFATKIESDQPVVVERAEYFGPPDARGGHASEAVAIPRTHWLLAEGSTQRDFNTFILIMNPNNTLAQVTAKYLREDGAVVSKTYTIAPTSRYIVWVNQFMPDVAFSSDIRSDVPVVVERAMYFNNFRGGTDSIGYGLDD